MEIDTSSLDGLASGIPQTPDSDIFISDVPNLPPGPETNCHITDSDSPPAKIVNTKGSTLKRKAPTVGKLVRSPVSTSTKRQRVHEAGASSDSDSSGVVAELSRSAAATRRLRELMNSGKFVMDEKKRATYEEKCVEVDARVRFRYGKKWEVLHSTCGRWFTMTEAYNTTRFRLHVEGCTSKGQNGLIDDFFKWWDGNGNGVSMKVSTPRGRKHVTIGGCRPKASARKNPSLDPPHCIPKPKLQACRGISKEHNDRIAVYISRALTDGAGSRSESSITTMLFGNDVKFSQLDETSRNNVFAAQVKLRSWTICRELQVVYSTKCRNFVNPEASKTCDRCLALLKLDVFKKALRMEPPSAKTAKFTPHRQYNGLRDLGINYAKIKGLSGLLDDVSTVACCDCVVFSLKYYS